MQISSHRADRLAEEIRAGIASLISGELRDPRIGFTTVLRVDLSADLQHARVHVSVLGDSVVQQETLEGLASATAYIRHTVGHRLRLRRVPEFSFVLDHGPEEGIRLEKLLERIHKGEPET
jgi:ribosome-binding factor A